MAVVSVLRILLSEDVDRNISSANHLLRASLVKYTLRALLRPFDLGLGDVELLYTATATVIAGSVIQALFDEAYVPDSIDFYCGRYLTRRVVRYLKHVGDFVQHAAYAGGCCAGIRRITMLQDRRGAVIRVLEASTLSPLEVVTGSALAGQREWCLFPCSKPRFSYQAQCF